VKTAKNVMAVYRKNRTDCKICRKCRASNLKPGGIHWLTVKLPFSPGGSGKSKSRVKILDTKVLCTLE
jgi:hypothetical protein